MTLSKAVRSSPERLEITFSTPHGIPDFRGFALESLSERLTGTTPITQTV